MDIQDIKDAFLKAQEEKQKENAVTTAQPFPGTCPSCGYCPHCGRGRATLYPATPWYSPWYTTVGPFHPTTSSTTCATTVTRGGC